MKKLLILFVLGASVQNALGVGVYFVNQSERLPATFRMYGLKDSIKVDAGTYRKVDVAPQYLQSVSVEGSLLSGGEGSVATQSRMQYKPLKKMPESGQTIAYRVSLYEPALQARRTGEGSMGNSGVGGPYVIPMNGNVMKLFNVQPMHIE